jgi:hypothetical protein
MASVKMARIKVPAVLPNPPGVVAGRGVHVVPHRWSIDAPDGASQALSACHAKGCYTFRRFMRHAPFAHVTSIDKPAPCSWGCGGFCPVSCEEHDPVRRPMTAMYCSGYRQFPPSQRLHLRRQGGMSFTASSAICQGSSVCRERTRSVHHCSAHEGLSIMGSELTIRLAVAYEDMHHWRRWGVKLF